MTTGIWRVNDTIFALDTVGFARYWKPLKGEGDKEKPARLRVILKLTHLEKSDNGGQTRAVKRNLPFTVSGPAAIALWEELKKAADVGLDAMEVWQDKAIAGDGL